MAIIHALIHVLRVSLFFFIQIIKGTWNNTGNLTCTYCNSSLTKCAQCINATSCEACEDTFNLYTVSADVKHCKNPCPDGKIIIKLNFKFRYMDKYNKLALRFLQ